jgi:hypothetical protein
MKIRPALYVLCCAIASACMATIDADDGSDGSDGIDDIDISDLGADDDGDDSTTPGSSEPPSLEAITTACLNADGAGGQDTYARIESVLGRGAIEHPDDDHHPPLRHIREDTDEQVGPHFVFLAHRDIDTDRQTNFDRSRIEIKVSPGGGPSALKARKGQTFTYTWRFKMNRDMGFSSRFTHMFQLKSSGGDDGSPLITITGRKSGSAGRLEVIHTGPPSKGVLGRVDLTGLKGVWLDVSVRATFDDHGALAMTIKKPGGAAVISINVPDLDLWRDGDHIRPKWGIYRGKSDQLRAVEEDVRFASFAITPSATPTSTCRLP